MRDPNTKPFWQSKTFWLNAAGLAVIVIEYLVNTQAVPPEAVATVLAILNFWLRTNGDATQTKNLTLK